MITSTICRILLGKCGRDSIYVLAHSEIRHVRRQNYRCYKQKRRRVRKLKLNWQSITEQYLRLGHRQYLLHHSRWIRSLSVQAWSRLSRGLRRWSGIKTFTNPAVLSGFRTEIEYTTHARCLKSVTPALLVRQKLVNSSSRDHARDVTNWLLLSHNMGH